MFFPDAVTEEAQSWNWGREDWDKKVVRLVVAGVGKMDLGKEKGSTVEAHCNEETLQSAILSGESVKEIQG